MSNNQAQDILSYQFNSQIQFCISSSDRFIPSGSAETRIGENMSFKRLTK